MGDIIKFLDWDRLKAYNPPLDLKAGDPMAALLPRKGETAEALCTRFTETLVALDHSLKAQRDDKANRSAEYDNRRCRSLVHDGIAEVTQNDALRAALAPRLPDVAQSLIDQDAGMMAAATIAGFAGKAGDELRLPELPVLLQLLEIVATNRPKGWDSYNGDSGRHIHNGDEVAAYYRDYFPLAQLLLKEPELPEEKVQHVLEPYIRRLSLEDWVAAAEPYFAKDARPSNHDPRPF